MINFLLEKSKFEYGIANDKMKKIAGLLETISMSSLAFCDKALVQKQWEELLLAYSDFVSEKYLVEPNYIEMSYSDLSELKWGVEDIFIVDKVLSEARRIGSMQEQVACLFKPPVWKIPSPKYKNCINNIFSLPTIQSSESDCLVWDVIEHYAFWAFYTEIHIAYSERANPFVELLGFIKLGAFLASSSEDRVDIVIIK